MKYDEIHFECKACEYLCCRGIYMNGEAEYYCGKTPKSVTSIGHCALCDKFAPKEEEE